MKSRVRFMVAILVIAALLAACAPPTPERVVETIIVQETFEVIKEGTPQIIEREVVITPTPEAKPFEGVEVNILTFTGP